MVDALIVSRFGWKRQLNEMWCINLSAGICTLIGWRSSVLSSWALVFFSSSVRTLSFTRTGTRRRRSSTCATFTRPSSTSTASADPTPPPPPAAPQPIPSMVSLTTSNQRAWRVNPVLILRPWWAGGRVVVEEEEGEHCQGNSCLAAAEETVGAVIGEEALCSVSTRIPLPSTPPPTYYPSPPASARFPLPYRGGGSASSPYLYVARPPPPPAGGTQHGPGQGEVRMNVYHAH